MLVKVLNKETGEAVSMGLQEMTLDKVRDKLFSTGIMKDDIMFLYDGAKVFRESETEILLGEILGGGHELLLGKNGDINQTFNVSDFTSLTNGEVLDFFKKKSFAGELYFRRLQGFENHFRIRLPLQKYRTLWQRHRIRGQSHHIFSERSMGYWIAFFGPLLCGVKYTICKCEGGYDFQKKEYT